MSYSMIGVSPEQFGAGTADGLWGVLGRAGDYSQAAMYGGMKLGSALTNYGTSQRLSGLREDVTRQGLNTLGRQSQNAELEAVTAQRYAACNALGWGSTYCQALKAEMEGRAPAGSATRTGTLPQAGYSMPSNILGTSPTYDAYDYQSQPAQEWYE